MAQQPIPPPPDKTPAVIKDTWLFTSVWVIWFTSIWTAIRAIGNITPPPVSSVGVVPGGGVFAFDQNYLYISVGKNLWKRIPLNSF